MVPSSRSHLYTLLERESNTFFALLSCQPMPLNLRGEDSPPKFKGRPSKNTIKQGVSDTPPLNLAGESSPLKFRGYGLTGCAAMREREQNQH